MAHSPINFMLSANSIKQERKKSVGDSQFPPELNPWGIILQQPSSSSSFEPFPPIWNHFSSFGLSFKGDCAFQETHYHQWNPQELSRTFQTMFISEMAQNLCANLSFKGSSWNRCCSRHEQLLTGLKVLPAVSVLWKRSKPKEGRILLQRSNGVDLCIRDAPPRQTKTTCQKNLSLALNTLKAL